MSRNVEADADARRRLRALGESVVPLVAKDGATAPGVDLAQVAALVGTSFDASPALPADELARRLRRAQLAAVALAEQFPPSRLGDRLPGRDRTCLALANHVVEIAAQYLAVADGAAFDQAASGAEPERNLECQALAGRAAAVAARLAAHQPRPERPVTTFFGASTLHAVLERCAWHAAQHTRQLAYMLERLGIEPAAALAADDLSGLPLPAGVWDG